MMYLISYDVADNKTRKKIADILLDYGSRVQYSVFECDISNKQYKEMYRKLVSEVEDKEEVSIRCYFLDKTSMDRLEIIGSPTYQGLNSDDIKKYDVGGLTKEEELLFI